jgi:gliding motility-associated lipoprotein GldD
MKNLVLISVLVLIFTSCGSGYTPKPRGYFRIDFPEKEYKSFESNCPFSFEYPAYSVIETVAEGLNENCWYNISIPAYKTKIHLTYKNIDGNLAQYIEDIHKIAYKHTFKADDIEERRIIRKKDKVYGILYSITGNTASSMSFFLTDSVQHFLSGALYFSSTPNSDSLAPSIQFFQEDVVHLTESLVWK